MRSWYVLPFLVHPPPVCVTGRGRTKNTQIPKRMVSLLESADTPFDLVGVDLDGDSIADAGKLLLTLAQVSTYSRGRINAAWVYLGQRMGLTQPTEEEARRRYHNPLLRTFKGHTTSVTSVCHVPATGSRPACLATGSRDATVKLWGVW